MKCDYCKKYLIAEYQKEAKYRVTLLSEDLAPENFCEEHKDEAIEALKGASVLIEKIGG